MPTIDFPSEVVKGWLHDMARKFLFHDPNLNVGNEKMLTFYMIRDKQTRMLFLGQPKNNKPDEPRNWVQPWNASTPGRLFSRAADVLACTRYWPKEWQERAEMVKFLGVEA